MANPEKDPSCLHFNHASNLNARKRDGKRCTKVSEEELRSLLGPAGNLRRIAIPGWVGVFSAYVIGSVLRFFRGCQQDPEENRNCGKGHK